MGWFSKSVGKLFGSGEALNKTLDIIDSVADDASFTAEEKSKFFIKYAETTKHQSPARRAIALLVTGTWTFTVFLCAICIIFELDERKESLLKLLEEVANPPFMLVLAFYFAIQFAKGKSNV